MANLANKTVLVTGASRGIGRATALVMANAALACLSTTESHKVTQIRSSRRSEPAVAKPMP
jgi:NAD(P)-dependent dehydrogenase (short-subunit alcohol dehydrogenase family)